VISLVPIHLYLENGHEDQYGMENRKQCIRKICVLQSGEHEKYVYSNLESTCLLPQTAGVSEVITDLIDLRACKHVYVQKLRNLSDDHSVWRRDQSNQSCNSCYEPDVDSMREDTAWSVGLKII
jgi:hypothetical protein